MKILLVEDNTRLRNALSDGLRQEGYSVDLAIDGEEAIAYKQSNHYEIIVLDLMLPKVDGLTFLKGIRQDHDGTHVIILSARDEIEDRVRGLELGADDYLTKPFSFNELCARIRAISRRDQGNQKLVRQVGPISIDLTSRQVFAGSDVISLTLKEYDVLETLSRRRGRVLTKRQLNEIIHDSNTIVSDNLIEVFISKLRRKIKAATGSSLIKTRHGFGYLIENVQD